MHTPNILLFIFPTNIAEGFEKNCRNEFIRYLKISKGSIGEVRTQLYIANSINYITEVEFNIVDNELNCLTKQTGKLISWLTHNKNSR
jgi:four helix bundle protein